MLLAPLSLKLQGREVAQGRVDTLMHVDIVQEAPDLTVGVMVVPVLGQVNCLLLDGSDEPLGIAVLPGLADLAILTSTWAVRTSGGSRTGAGGSACRAPSCGSTRTTSWNGNGRT